MNTATMTVNVVADPEAIELQGEGARKLASFRVGQSERQGDQTFENGFFDVSAFGTLAQNVLASVRKGDRLIVTGRFQQSNGANADGTRWYRTRFVAQAIGLSLEFEPAHRAPKPAATVPAEAPEAL